MGKKFDSNTDESMVQKRDTRPKEQIDSRKRGK
jgi:hypothetical protein